MNNSIRIADTTREERDYIDGRRELREINAEFHARYMSGEGPGSDPERGRCGFAG